MYNKGYKVLITGNGNVSLTGVSIKPPGQISWSISDDIIEKINKSIEHLDFFDLKEKNDYFLVIDDDETCFLTIEMDDGRERTIIDYASSRNWPGNLRRFITRVKKLTGIEEKLDDNF